MEDAVLRFGRGHGAENEVTSCLGLEEEWTMLLCGG